MIIELHELAFNSRMTDVHQGSDLDQIVDGMNDHSHEDSD